MSALLELTTSVCAVHLVNNTRINIIKDGCTFAFGQFESGDAAFVHNGRAGEGGCGGDQSVVLGELRGAAPALNPEPAGERQSADEAEADEERALLPEAADPSSTTLKPLCTENKYPQTAS